MSNPMNFHGNSLYVGIDVSSKDNVVCCLTKDSEKLPVSRFTVQNNRPGIIELRDRISQLAQKNGISEILFGLEHTGCYSMHAAMHLQRHLLMLGTLPLSSRRATCPIPTLGASR